MIKKTEVSRLRKILCFIAQYYFRAEVRGLENIPDGPCLLVGNHNGGATSNPESWILFAHVHPLTPLSHDILFKLPLISGIARQHHLIPAKFEAAKEALLNGKRVLVYPGGGWESCRPSRDRDKIDFKGRTGFARLAQSTGVPLVPVVAAGAHDGWHVFFRGDKIAKILKLDRLFRIDVFPIGLGLPYGLVISAFFPVIPLPRKIIIQILPPVLTDNEKISESALAHQVIQQMQYSLSVLVQELPRSKNK